MSAQPFHTITVTRVEDELGGNTSYPFTVNCPGTKTCHIWYECMICEKNDFVITEETEDDGEYVAHGVFHQQIDGNWSTETNECALSTTDAAYEACVETADYLGAGTHEVDIDYLGDGEWVVIPAGAYWATGTQTICAHQWATYKCQRPQGHTLQHHTRRNDMTWGEYRR